METYLSTGIPLLATKLRAPHLRAGLMPRAHLADLLQRILERPVCLVSAPAGFGKTSLLAAWCASAAGSRCRLAWLTLDEGDSDPVRFWHYVVSAISAAQPGVGEGARALLRSVAQTPAAQSGFGWLEAAATSLLNDLARSAAESGEQAEPPFFLVLDDYHTIRNPAIHNTVAFFIEYLPTHAHLVILTRADPPLPLARLRARDQLVEIRAADLRFRADESEAFLNQVQALHLPADAVASLATRTEGWAAGLRLAALSLQGRDAQAQERFIREFRGTQHHVFSYLVEEVFSRQPLEIQRFLLRTSILSYLTAPLCDAVVQGDSISSPVSHSQAMLGHLERDNLFIVPLDDERRWYRYHPLFAEALRGRLVEVEPDLTPALHRQAARWYEANGLLADAVRHALAAGDQAYVVRLVEAVYRRLVMQGEIATLRGWLDALPGDLVRSRPRLGLATAWTMGFSGLHDLQEQALHWVAAALGEQWRDEDREDELAPSQDIELDKLRGEWRALRAMMESSRWECRRAVEHAQAAMWLLWPDSWAEFFQEPEAEPASLEDLWLRAVILHALGNAYRLGGNVAAAERTYRETLRLTMAAGSAQEPSFPMIALTAALHLGQVLVNQGRLRDAERVYCGQLAQVRQRGGELLLFSGEVWINLGRLQAEQDRLAEAEASIRQGIEYCRRVANPLAEIAGYLALAGVAWAMDQPAVAHAEFARAEQLAAGGGRAYLLPVVAAQRAWLGLATGDFALAEHWADDLIRQRAGRGEFPCIIRDLEDLRLAEVCLAQGRLAEAQDTLDAILHEAEAAGRNETVIAALVLAACVSSKQGDGERAGRELVRALALAEPEGYVRVFADKGAPLGHLLSQARRLKVEARIAAYADRLLARLAPEYGAEPPASTPPELAEAPRFDKLRTPLSDRGQQAYGMLAEPLTARELEILGLMARGAANQDIAAQLCLSVGTVKGHINHILGKLAVRNRTEAAVRARELGLLET